MASGQSDGDKPPGSHCRDSASLPAARLRAIEGISVKSKLLNDHAGQRTFVMVLERGDTVMEPLLEVPTYWLS
jgi:hypothetical protein